MTSFIPLSVPTLNGREARYINECLETNWVSSAGRFVDTFGKLCASIAGARFGIPIVNGTAALHLSVILCGIKPDEEVIIPALTFIGTAAGVRHAGAHAPYRIHPRSATIVGVCIQTGHPALTIRNRV